MSQSLDDIIKEVQLSEKEFQSRHQYLAKLKDEKLTKEKEIKDLEEKCLQMQENTSVKMKCLCDREVILVSLTVRQKALKDRIEELNAENKALTGTMTNLQTKLSSMRQELYDKTEKFVQYFKPMEKVGKCHQSFMSRGITHKLPEQEENRNCFNNCEENSENLDAQPTIVFDIDFNSNQYPLIGEK